MDHQKITISGKSSVKEALKKLDQTAEKVLLVVTEDNALLGTLTDGDVRRYILKGKKLEDNIEQIYNKNPVSIQSAEYSIELAREIMLLRKIELIPIVNETNKIIDYIPWDKAFGNRSAEAQKGPSLGIPAIIMAGGKGTRLEPFTNVLPKPLIPAGNKTIIETIMDRFIKNGIEQFYISLNYKGEMIQAYFKSIDNQYDARFIHEKDYYGTAGSLKLLKSEEIKDDFIVSNCDVIVDTNYAEVLKFHQENEAVLTILSSIRHHKMPYGVISFKKGGVVSDIVEKPEFTVTINTGVYIMNKECLGFIPKNKRFDMPELIKVLLKADKKIITYPVNESNYIDIGQWDEYKKAIAKLKV